MEHEVTAGFGLFPQRLPAFHTDRFIVAPLAPSSMRQFAEVLLGDEALAEQVPWLEDKTHSGVEHQAKLLELQCQVGITRAWVIVEREGSHLAGAVLASQGVDGLDVEILCSSSHTDEGIADEVGPPLAEWLEDNSDPVPVSMH